VIGLQPGQAIAVDWTAERYHGDTETTSRSQLGDLADPERYFLRHEARTLPPDPRSASMQLGTAVHLAVLEPQEWQRRKFFAKPKRPKGATKNAKPGTAARINYDAWKAICDAWERVVSHEAIVVEPEEMQRVETMAERVRTQEFIAELLAKPGRSEQTVLWHHPPIEYQVQVGRELETHSASLVVRVRVDRLVDLDEIVLVVLDLKTTESAEPTRFGYSIADYGYLMQAALYTDAVRALCPDREVHFVFAVVSSKWPYKRACYALTDEDLEEGRNQYRAAMVELLTRRHTGDWTEDWQKSCQFIKLPRRAYRTPKR
jgi:hypothetical protein